MKNKLLSYLLKGKISFWKMTSHMTYMPGWVSVLKKMEKDGLVEIKNTYISLTAKGRKAASALKLVPHELPFLGACELKPDEKLLSRYKKYRKDKLFEKEEFDQLQITEEGVIKKIGVMRKLGDLRGKRVICLGDDDLVGIALALTGEPKEITVLDIDKEVLDYENSVLEKLGYGKSAFSCDFLKPIPEKFRGRYDVFITEPPDTVKGVTLFFSRGVECLNSKGGLAYLGISRNDLKPEEFMLIEENVFKMKGLVTDMFSHFEGYNPSKIDFDWVIGLPKGVTDVAKEPWFFSDLWRVEVLQGAKPLVKGKKGTKFRKGFIKTEIHLNE
jgi:N4-bis(aminopropyl)spermidine synthase